MTLHVGRSFVGHHIEDECPCPQATCGLVARAEPGCEHHGWRAAKTLRQMHEEADCEAVTERTRKEREHWERSLERPRTTHP